MFSTERLVLSMFCTEIRFVNGFFTASFCECLVPVRFVNISTEISFVNVSLPVSFVNVFYRLVMPMCLPR